MKKMNKLKRSTRGMPIPKYSVEEIEKNMTIEDAIKILYGSN